MIFIFDDGPLPIGKQGDTERDGKTQQHVIRTKDYTYECGDGCCFEQGVDVFVGEEHICSVPSLEYAIEELFEHFGIDVRVQHG